jgi:hypothetical protein
MVYNVEAGGSRLRSLQLSLDKVVVHYWQHIPVPV